MRYHLKVRKLTAVLNGTFMLKTGNPLWYLHVINMAKDNGIPLNDLSNVIGIDLVKEYAEKRGLK